MAPKRLFYCSADSYLGVLSTLLTRNTAVCGAASGFPVLHLILETALLKLRLADMVSTFFTYLYASLC